MQRRRHSVLEAFANVAVGLLVNLAANALILPAFGYHPTLRQNVGLVACYTVVSVVRSYALRRAFNRVGR